MAVFVRLDVQDVSGRPSAEGDFAGGLDPDELGERERGSHAEAVGAIGRQALIRGGEPEGYSEGLVVARARVRTAQAGTGEDRVALVVTDVACLGYPLHGAVDREARLLVRPLRLLAITSAHRLCLQGRVRPVGG